MRSMGTTMEMNRLLFDIVAPSEAYVENIEYFVKLDSPHVSHLATKCLIYFIVLIDSRCIFTKLPKHVFCSQTKTRSKPTRLSV